MGLIIGFDDFTGQLALPDDPQVRDLLDEYIREYEPAYLKLLMGESLYLEMKAEVVEDPVPDRWTKLIEGETFEVDGKQREYRGVRRMLAGFVFVVFVREFDRKMSAMGIVVEDTETARQAGRQEQAAILQGRYNESVALYKSAQEYIEERNRQVPGVYDGYEPITLEKKYWGGWL